MRDNGDETPWHDRELETGIEEAKQALAAIEQRYDRLRQTLVAHEELERQEERLQRQVRKNSSPELRRQLQAARDRLQALESDLEALFSVWEPFWFAVRFGGLGVILGWVLKSCSS